MQIKTQNEIQHIWTSADCVCFDVDSTVCTNEAIDDLAVFNGVGEEVQKLTLEAMGGNMSFREALRKRLSIIKPSMNAVNIFNTKQISHLTPGITELVELLNKRKVPVYLVSGGFRILINPVADILNISRGNVFANTIIFNEQAFAKQLGEYVGFDENEMTSESGGKGKVIEFLKNKFEYKKIVMIGDGMTDLESCPPGDAFIGFGGNVVREKVKKNSGWFVTSFEELMTPLTS